MINKMINNYFRGTITAEPVTMGTLPNGMETPCPTDYRKINYEVKLIDGTLEYDFYASSMNDIKSTSKIIDILALKMDKQTGIELQIKGIYEDAKNNHNGVINLSQVEKLEKEYEEAFKEVKEFLKTNKLHAINNCITSNEYKIIKEN